MKPETTFTFDREASSWAGRMCDPSTQELQGWRGSQGAKVYASTVKTRPTGGQDALGKQEVDLLVRLWNMMMVQTLSG